VRAVTWSCVKVSNHAGLLCQRVFSRLDCPLPAPWLGLELDNNDPPIYIIDMIYCIIAALSPSRGIGFGQDCRTCRILKTVFSVLICFPRFTDPSVKSEVEVYPNLPTSHPSLLLLPSHPRPISYSILLRDAPHHVSFRLIRAPGYRRARQVDHRSIRVDTTSLDTESRARRIRYQTTSLDTS
jgi:hypothetical protein